MLDTFFSFLFQHLLSFVHKKIREINGGVKDTERERARSQSRMGDEREVGVEEGVREPEILERGGKS